MNKRGIAATLCILILAAALTSFLTGCGQGAESLINRADTLVRTIQNIGAELSGEEVPAPDLPTGDLLSCCYYE